MASQFLSILWYWQDEEDSWWTQFWVGETVGIDYLWLLGGWLFAVAIGYGIYTTMLYNQVAARRHPANFRRFIYALVLFLCIVWFEYVFRHAFGGLMLYFLLFVVVAAWLVFYLTRRKPAGAQS
jgi:Ca2+/Na+ antiporter